MAYIGTSPSNGVRRVHTYTATAGQTTFTGSSTEGVTLTYADTNYIDVFQNGVLLGSADYTSTSGTSVVLAQGASVSDLVVIVVYDVFSVADTVSKTSGGTFDGGVTMSNNLTVSGAFTSQGIDDNADATAITIDSSERVGIGETVPLGKTHIKVGDTGADVSAQGNLLVLEDVENGLSILSSASGAGYINFGDSGDNNIGMIVYDHSANALITYVNASERMRIVSDGSVYIASSSLPSASAGGFAVKKDSVGSQIYNSSGTYTSTFNQVRFWNGNGNIGNIVTNGSATAYNTSSDHRLKENVDYTFDATTRLKQLKPARFNFIADADTTVDGFLAHEVSSVVPEAISGTHNEVDDDGNPVMQGIDQSKLVPLLVKTIQELEARITALENGE